MSTRKRIHKESSYLRNEASSEDELHKVPVHSGSLPGMDDPRLNPENYLLHLVRPVRRVLILPHVIPPELIQPFSPFSLRALPSRITVSLPSCTWTTRLGFYSRGSCPPRNSGQSRK